MNKYIECEYCGKKKHISQVELIETETDDAVICFDCRKRIECEDEARKEHHDKGKVHPQ